MPTKKSGTSKPRPAGSGGLSLLPPPPGGKSAPPPVPPPSSTAISNHVTPPPVLKSSTAGNSGNWERKGAIQCIPAPPLNVISTTLSLGTIGIGKLLSPCLAFHLQQGGNFCISSSTLVKNTVTLYTKSTLPKHSKVARQLKATFFT